MWRSNPWLFVDHVTDAPKSETDQLNQDKLQGRGCKVSSIKEFEKEGQLICGDYSVPPVIKNFTQISDQSKED